MSETTPLTILKFWFEEISITQQFKRDPDFDAQIKDRFGEVIQAATAGECVDWRLGGQEFTPAMGRLAEIIVLDQFRRNVYRDQPAAFAADPLALVLAQEMIARGDDKAIELSRRNNVYLPFMHSESKFIQRRSMEIYTDFVILKGEGTDSSLLGYARSHADIVERFGRFPHRNITLGRTSTPEEIEFLKQPGSSF